MHGAGRAIRLFIMLGYACGALVRAGVEAGVIEIQPSSFLVPHLRFNRPLFYICLQGEGYFGMADETGSSSLPCAKVGPGDVIGVPPGWTHWAAHGHLRLLRLALSPSVTDQAVLGGSRHPGNILQGFSTEYLGNVVHQSPHKVGVFLSSTQAGGIMKLSESTLHEIAALETQTLQDVRRQYITSFNFASSAGPAADINLNAAVAWRCRTALDFPHLKDCPADILHIYLPPDTYLDPSLHATSDLVGYVMGGGGKVEISYPGGTSAARESLSSGSVLVVPKGFAFGIWSMEEQPLELFCLLPQAGGRKFAKVLGEGSVYSLLPRGIVADSFGVSTDEVQQTILL